MAASQLDQVLLPSSLNRPVEAADMATFPLDNVVPTLFLEEARLSPGHGYLSVGPGRSSSLNRPVSAPDMAASQLDQVLPILFIE